MFSSKLRNIQKKPLWRNQKKKKINKKSKKNFTKNILFFQYYEYAIRPQLSSPGQSWVKKTEKISNNFSFFFFQEIWGKKKKREKKMAEKMLLCWFCQLRRIVFYQSSPVHPVSESRGGGLSVMEKDREGRRRTQILASSIGYPLSRSLKNGQIYHEIDFSMYHLLLLYGENVICFIFYHSSLVWAFNAIFHDFKSQGFLGKFFSMNFQVCTASRFNLGFDI